jgi:uncharacterized membrane protein YcgQ (UPF0703/DUF1980 family)
MRRKLLIALAVLAALAVGGMSWKIGRGLAVSSADSVVVIGDKRFVMQLEDMAVNAKSYAGKTVRVEGFALPLGKNAPWKFAVARNYFCCGADGYPVGLPCEYSEDMPKKDAWIEIEGKFRIDDQDRAYLEIVTLMVKDTPGQRNVFS